RAVKKSQAPASLASWTAATGPPPAASSNVSSACAISPRVGTRSTTANSTHSTCPTTAHLTVAQACTFPRMMETMTAPQIPPFERFYEEHRDVVLGVLRRKRGRAATGDVVRSSPAAKEDDRMTVSPQLDRRFREAAGRERLVDLAYDVADSPVGELLLAATEHGVCRVSFDPDPDLDELAQTF